MARGEIIQTQCSPGRHWLRWGTLHIWPELWQHGMPHSNCLTYSCVVADRRLLTVSLSPRMVVGRDSTWWHLHPAPQHTSPPPHHLPHHCTPPPLTLTVTTPLWSTPPPGSPQVTDCRLYLCSREPRPLAARPRTRTPRRLHTPTTALVVKLANVSINLPTVPTHSLIVRTWVPSISLYLQSRACPLKTSTPHVRPTF